MFDSNVLDVAIGLALFFLFVSLMCSAVREMLAALTRARAADLERGIRNLFAEESGTGAVQQFFDHPRIAALFLGRYDPRGLTSQSPRGNMRRREREHLPSYIPANQFSTTLIDIITRGQSAGRAAAITAAELRSAAESFPNEAVRTAVLSALDAAQDDINRAKASLEDWFNAAMDRVSGWYKQRTQVILFAIGLLAAGVFNLDALEVGRQLQTSAALRTAVVARAVDLETLRPPAPAPEEATEQAAAEDAPTPATDEAAEQTPEAPAPASQPDEATPEAKNATSPAPSKTSVSDRLDAIIGEFGALGYSTGWRDCPPEHLCEPEQFWETWPSRIAGWLITALAVTLGAPFWFDLLSKFMSIRSAIKPNREETASEAPPPPPARTPPRTGAAAAVAAGANAAEGADEPHEWAHGDPQGGRL
jgi:outer membrane biosynthesis protein TonB